MKRPLIASVVSLVSGCEKEDTKKEKEGFQFLILIVRGSFYLLEAFPDLYRFSLPSLFPLVIISLNLLWLFLVRSYRAVNDQEIHKMRCNRQPEPVL